MNTRLLFLSLLAFGLLFNAFAQNAILVKDLTPGKYSSFDDTSNDLLVANIGDRVLFVIRDASSISRLYISDGTDAGTVLLQELTSSDQSYEQFIKVDAATVAFVVSFNNKASGMIYKTDGTVVSLLDKHNSTYSVEQLKVFNSDLYYISNDFTLRKIDLANVADTPLFYAGRFLIDFYMEAVDQAYIALRYPSSDSLYLRDLQNNSSTNLGYIGTSNYSPLDFHKVNGKIVFFSNVPSQTRILFLANGQSGQVEQLKVFSPTSGKKYYAMANNRLFFDAALSVNDPNFDGFKLWTTDGTTEGTIVISNSGSYPNNFAEYGTVYNNLFYYMSSDGESPLSQMHLHSSDGSAFNAAPLFEDFLSASLFFSNLLVVDGKLYAAGYDDKNYDYGNEIWDISGTTPELYETAPGSASIFEYGAYATDTKLFFVGNEEATGYELYLFQPNVVTANKEEESIKGLVMYPNPATEYVTVKSDEPLTYVQLMDCEGKELRRYTGSYKLSLEGLAPGMYYLKLYSGEKTAVMKLMKQ